MESPRHSQGPLRLLCLGDSYTIGEAVEVEQRWPLQLAALLSAQGLTICDPEIVAQTGWTGDELLAALDALDHRLQPPYDLVTLLIGVNDQYRGRPVAEFAQAFHRLLQRAIGYAGGNSRRVLVLSIPDWGITPFAASQARVVAEIAAQIDAYNDQSRSVTERVGASYLYITDLTREAATQPALLATDGLHPAGADYGRWAGRALNRLADLGWAGLPPASPSST